jgi:hypothetical protein
VTFLDFETFQKRKFLKGFTQYEQEVSKDGIFVSAQKEFSDSGVCAFFVFSKILFFIQFR